MDSARSADSPAPESSARLTARNTDPARAAELFEQSVAIMARLRAPGGCPWDQKQTFDTIRKYTLEEAYEVFDAIERRDFPHLAEELGDLLLQVLFYAEMAANEGRFTIADVLDALNRKLIRRHPHVFGEEASRAAGNRANVDADVQGSASAVLRNWEEIKALEKKPPAAEESRLDRIPRALPALAEAAKIGAEANKVGFDWPQWREVFRKVEEEMRELEAEVRADPLPRNSRIAAELGDLLFTVVNLSRHLHADAEMALRGSNLRFRQRFRAMEQMASRPLEELEDAELEELWNAAKKQLAESSAEPES
jgi:MazG family protein